MKQLFCFFSILFLSLYQLLAAIELPAVISNGMVLQRDIKVPIWGWGEPGAKVKVSFAGQTQRTEIDSDGKWMLRLNPMKASAESRILSIEVDSEKVELKDVLVGEVWLCSGQSNMQWTVGASARKTKDPNDQPVADWIAAHKKTARDPLLRQIAVPMKTSYDKELNHFKGTWIASTSEANNDQFTATGYFFALELRKELGVPVGLLKCPWGGKKIQPFIPSTHYNSVPELNKYYEQAMANMLKASSAFDPKKAEANYQKALEKWKEKVKVAKQNKKPAPRRPKKAIDPKLDANFPSTIYNAMINPLVPFAIRGAIWYQGESNAGSDANMYGQFLEALATGWRTRWGQGDFPLYYCQLAKFREPSKEPLGDNGWVTVCDQMRRTLSFKNTGMAVLNDAGEVSDIHPRNKVDAGKRLSLWALAKDYGRTDLVYSGPLYESSKTSGNKVTIQFSHVGEGLMTARKHLLEPARPIDEHVQGFQICGADKTWKWARAKIISPSEVEVYHPEIDQPVEVRYAWSANPENANLYNKSGLPTSCFTTLD
jgi:sialate O-acetylesterase